MRFFSYRVDGVDGLAVQVGENSFRGLPGSSPHYPGSLDDIVRSDGYAAAARKLSSGEAVDPERVTLRPPVSGSGKILCIGLNYLDHAAESAMALPESPTVFARFRTGLVAHNAPLVRPRVSSQFDYEGELAAVIGKPGRAISEADALDHVAGYTIFNDGSVRDYQMRTPQWTVGKNFDGTGALGPVFVTAEELPPGAAGLRLETRLNGETMQSASTGDLVFDVAKLVSFLSVAMTLEPGDLIVTGTPAGVGFARKPPVFMQPGDVCEVSIEGIGVLRNRVVAE